MIDGGDCRVGVALLEKLAMLVLVLCYLLCSFLTCFARTSLDFNVVAQTERRTASKQYKPENNTSIGGKKKRRGHTPKKEKGTASKDLQKRRDLILRGEDKEEKQDIRDDTHS